ncbi:adenylate/guanylate cyclase family protein [Roseiarcus fermentans]|uniref:Adenylate/guanylate cyclase family protein n=1 Tax=Roseiarcus fermentans TaxID=1473586 RepID=A0A366EJN2_9HYPH|nr:adenylate/guanylate cyclase domain-containing protein [Roseiarcus fermentans]RBP02544.1 adenylate/guanylate cyclase family protein [Roseiarcus fermentans]
MTRASAGYAIVRIAAAAAAVSAIYSEIAHGEFLPGAVIGFVNGATMSWVELVVIRAWAEPVLRRLPFLVTLCARAALLFAVALLVNAIFVPLFNGFSLAQVAELRDIVFALSVSLVLSVVLGVADLLGLDVLLGIVVGRYHRPRLEERALLFIDLCASTATAERLGGPRFLDFLNAVFADLSGAIVDNGGEIHKYVGDEIIAAWRLAPGRNEPRILLAWAAARARLAAGAERYRRDFGLAPDFRAALHAGEVVVGELGSRKKEIALIGDPMNTAARMLDACRDLDRPALASIALMERLAAPPGGFQTETIAPLPLRGKAVPLALVSLALEGAPAAVVAPVCA